MSTDKIQTGLRLKEITYKKIKILAAQEQRSLNNFLEHMIQNYIEDYEAKNGPIPVPGED